MDFDCFQILNGRISEGAKILNIGIPNILTFKLCRLGPFQNRTRTWVHDGSHFINLFGMVMLVRTVSDGSSNIRNEAEWFKDKQEVVNNKCILVNNSYKHLWVECSLYSKCMLASQRVCTFVPRPSLFVQDWSRDCITLAYYTLGSIQ